MDGAFPPLMFPPNLSNIALVDCDEVLLCWHAGFRRWAERELAIELDPEGPKNYGLKGWLPESHTHQSSELVRKFNSNPEYGFGMLEPIPGARALIERLHETGHKVRVITACSLDPAVQMARVENLTRIFGPEAFDDISFVDLSASKQAELIRHPPSLLLDDLPKHIFAGMEAGHFGVVVGASHNRELRGEERFRKLPWIDSHDELLPHIPMRADAAQPSLG